MEAQEEAAAAKAAAAGSDASDGVELGDDDQGATARATPAVAAGGTAQMQPMTVQFVLGHLTVGRLASWGEARTWSASDPIERGGGYGGGAHLNQWMVLDEPALRVVPTGQFRRSFAIHCLDHPASAELRANTREAHLEWLRASGRVQLAGPLVRLELTAEGASGPVDVELTRSEYAAWPVEVGDDVALRPRRWCWASRGRSLRSASSPPSSACRGRGIRRAMRFLKSMRRSSARR